MACENVCDTATPLTDLTHIGGFSSPIFCIHTLLKRYGDPAVHIGRGMNDIPKNRALNVITNKRRISFT